ncbi:hypothetical protein GCM10010425_10210 [Streptomyces spororaveus]|uniref:Uncharacterized protein n=1 Tax=Streptomyces spororaveus TaxID=284039 RepID=A0ABQ3TN97_9ACTN|nr:hypothetical protein Sspor_74700 [Streptomyces spororaveus]
MIDSCGLPSGWIVATVAKTGLSSMSFFRSSESAADTGRFLPSAGCRPRADWPRRGPATDSLQNAAAPGKFLRPRAAPRAAAPRAPDPGSWPGRSARPGGRRECRRSTRPAESRSRRPD